MPVHTVCILCSSTPTSEDQMDEDWAGGDDVGGGDNAGVAGRTAEGEEGVLGVGFRGPNCAVARATSAATMRPACVDGAQQR